MKLYKCTENTFLMKYATDSYRLPDWQIVVFAHDDIRH